MDQATPEVITEVVPVETAETPVVPTGETAKPEGAEVVKPVDEKRFTQAELNEHIEKRLARENRKRERELEAEVRRLGQTQQAPKVESPSDPAAPKRDDFEDYQEYLRADARYVALEAVKADRKAQEVAASEAKVKVERESALQEFGKREAVARAKYPDFEDVMDVARTLPIKDATFEAITHLDEGWDVLHYLGTHPEEAQRISLLHPTRQAAEVGRLAAKVASQPASKPASVSKAPAPIEPVGGNVVGTDKAPDDPDEYLKWHNAQLRAKAAGKRT